MKHIPIQLNRRYIVSAWSGSYVYVDSIINCKTHLKNGKYINPNMIHIIEPYLIAKYISSKEYSTYKTLGYMNSCDFQILVSKYNFLL